MKSPVKLLSMFAAAALSASMAARHWPAMKS